MSDVDGADDLDDLDDEVDTHNLIDPDLGPEGDDGDEGGDGPAPTARAVLQYLVEQVVDDPDAVQLSVSEGRRGPSLDVRVGAGDMGRVIGKRGRVAQSIRAVTRAAAAKDGEAVDIEFLD